MKQYKLINDVLGWVVFAIAAFTYCSTVEPTASFWDCPEFISTANKLEVGHPPGAPFFMLVGNFFAQFASDVTQVAKMVNYMSALLSAGCILFLFWSITHLAKKLIVNDSDTPSLPQTIAIMASGVAGALIYTWSDTFWFSAVEGEVYAFSSFFTAIVFWLILKWENNADKPGADKWLVFIAYLTGLSIGVHLLNLLCIPAIVLVYYYKMCKNPTGKGSLIVLCVSAAIVAAVLYGVVPGIVKIGGWFELLFVNELGFAYNTGLYVYLVLLVASLVWALWETTRPDVLNKKRMYTSFLVATGMLGIPFYGHGTMSVAIGVVILAALAAVLFIGNKATQRILNTAVLCMTVMTIGYSSYALIVIRSTANPPMDQNSPEDVFTLGEYLGREQYGDRPLFFGQTYLSKPAIVDKGDGYLSYDIKKGAPVYQRKDKADPSEKDEYVMIREKFELNYPFNQCQLFPRMYSDNHSSAYESWLGGVNKHSVEYRIPGREPQTVEIPNQLDNIRFFLSYQCNWMYWRYFMWNFAGRQNDIQSHGELEHGNWLSGFPALDNARLGDQSMLPSDLKENKGHNVFYCLPLILGLLGFFWQALMRGKRGIQQFWVVFFLFFMTGLAIVVYLNQTPLQPRERDYAYAGSFYAFAIWCGLGITALFDLLCRWMETKKSSVLMSSVICVVPAIAVPLQMVSQTWDDHDRSNRFVCRDFGLNYLETIPHDGVIYTNGDNDTFPLWYNEDVEGNRTDVRVCNLSYLQTDWYIDQMKRPAFEGEGMSSPLPISWKRWQYTSGKNEMIDVNPDVAQGFSMSDLIKQVYEQDSATAVRLWGDEPFELKNAIKHFVLKEYDGLTADELQMVQSLPTCFPSDTLYVTVDKDAVRKSGMKMPNDSIPDRMEISLAGQDRVTKSFAMMLEMIAQSNFSRPLYMSTTVGESNYGNLYRHFMQEGIAWRITPYTFDSNVPSHTVCDTERMYDNMMNKYRYGNLSHPDLYIDETTMRMCYTHRRWFAVLITNLVSEGKKDKALKALDKCEKEIPSYNVPHDMGSYSLDLAQAYVDCGKPERAAAILEQLERKSTEYVKWYLSLDNARFAIAQRNCYSDLYGTLNIQALYKRMGETSSPKRGEYAKKAVQLDDTIQTLWATFQTKCINAGIQL